MDVNRMLLVLGCIVCLWPVQGQELKREWVSDGEFEVPESVLCSEVHGCLFVSNISGKPDGKDARGFISKVDFSGKVIELEWMTGLSAPKGMAADSTFLYVSDIDELVIIDIGLNQIHNRIKKEEAKFLNDVTISKQGDVFVSDMGRNQILKLKDGKLKLWMGGERLSSVNGLYCDGDDLVAGTSAQLLRISLVDQSVEVLADGLPAVDGIEGDGDGGYYFSSWQGLLFHLAPGEDPVLLLDTTTDEINCADIGYAPQMNLVIVPTFFDNKVVAYSWGN